MSDDEKPLDTATLVKQIDQMTKKRMAEEQVVSLDEFRKLKRKNEKLNILIVEDDVSMQKALSRIVESEGYVSFLASDGTELSHILQMYQLDLIILDVGLPWVNGLELATLIRKSRELKDLPLIFVSGLTSDEDVQKGFDVGANDYIKKPFNVSDIKKSIAALVN